MSDIDFERVIYNIARSETSLKDFLVEHEFCGLRNQLVAAPTAGCEVNWSGAPANET